MTSRSALQTTGRRPRDLVLSVAVLLVPILLVVLLFQYLGADDEVTVVDPGPAIAKAQAAGLRVARPEGLASGWRPTSAVVREDAGMVTLRLGYVAPSGGFMQLVESNQDAADLLRREVGDGRPEGVVRIRDASWQTYPGRHGERALVLMQPKHTLIVLGRAPAGELRELAGSLR